jgi:hypothetical protein
LLSQLYINIYGIYTHKDHQEPGHYLYCAWLVPGPAYQIIDSSEQAFNKI